MDSISELKIDNKFVDITLKLDIFNLLLLKSNLQSLIYPTEVLQNNNDLDISIINEVLHNMLDSINLLKLESILKNSLNDISISKCNTNINNMNLLVTELLEKLDKIYTNLLNSLINIPNLQKSTQDTTNEVSNINLDINNIENKLTALTSSIKSLSLNILSLLLIIDKLCTDLKGTNEVLESLKTSKEMSVQAMKLAWEVSNKISKM